MTRPAYTPAELLPLSGIQHFLFCRRQWALIHVERQWQENVRTVEGKLLHQRADQPFVTETRRGLITARAVPVASYSLGLAGVCDVVEFSAAPQGVTPEGVTLPGRAGWFLPVPVEYKRGHAKEGPDKEQAACDEAQLCAQAICLEEMLAVRIAGGFLYYGETRRRVSVDFSPALRALVQEMAAEMHAYFERGYTPRVKPSKACRACSLAELCLPDLQSRQETASAYIRHQLELD